MPVLLSLAVVGAAEAAGHDVIGAGPDGLFVLRDGELIALPQPMSALYACAVAGDRLLVAGAPFGTAARRIVDGDVLVEVDAAWQGGWMDHTTAPVVTVATLPAPNGDSPTLLAATAGDGILRTTNRGVNWGLCNFGLEEYVVLALACSPAPAGNAWLDRQVAFAGTETGLYRSPAAGLAWKRVPSAPRDAVQAIAVSPRFHADGVVLLGAENSGIWRSCDGGRTFAAVTGTATRVDALLATSSGFLAGSPEGVFHARDGADWRRVSDAPALALLQVGDSLIVGNETGIVQLPMPKP